MFDTYVNVCVNGLLDAICMCFLCCFYRRFVGGNLWGLLQQLDRTKEEDLRMLLGIGIIGVLIQVVITLPFSITDDWRERLLHTHFFRHPADYVACGAMLLYMFMCVSYIASRKEGYEKRLRDLQRRRGR